MIGLWVQKRGETSGRWHRVGERVHLADTAEKVLEVLKDGYDNAFTYTPKEFDGSEPIQPVAFREPGAKRELPSGLRIRFRPDFKLGEGGDRAEPGDAFFVPCTRGAGGDCPYWDDCDGQHLYVVCPDGRWWNIDGRANNCTLKDDRAHRCWVRTGDPAAGTLHVGKNGKTCQAGAGSINTGTYHGMLEEGRFRP